MHNAVTRGREKGRLSRFRHLQFLEALSLGTRVSLPGRCIASTSQGNSRDVKYRVLLCLIPRSPTKNANPLPIVTGHNPVTLASNCVFLALTLIFLPILLANSAPSPLRFFPSNTIYALPTSVRPFALFSPSRCNIPQLGLSPFDDLAFHCAYSICRVLLLSLSSACQNRPHQQAY